MVKQQITAKYEWRDLGELDRILNMEVTRTVYGSRFLSQYLYVNDVSEKVKEYLPGDAETPTDNEIFFKNMGPVN